LPFAIARAKPFNRGSLYAFLDLLGRFADTGKRVKAAYDKGDYETARKLYQDLAAHGNSDAILRLAVMCAQGKDGPVNNVQAVKWFRELANGGNREAQFGMGQCYDKGSGVEQNYAEARRWYLKSAQEGFTGGVRKHWGDLFGGARGGPDRIEAPKWFLLAGPSAGKTRAMMDRVLTEDEKVQVKKRADEWRPGGK
jgi:hypothetical protein